MTVAERIQFLLMEAASEGDEIVVALCKRALRGDIVAWRACVAMLGGDDA